MKNLLLIVSLGFLGLLVNSGCIPGISLARIDGPYEGKIIDAETGRTIEGVVVLGVWTTITITPGGGVYDYYDARETVTDKNGEFFIPGMGLRVLSNVTPMDVLIFKAGYEHIGMGQWSGLKSVGWKGEYEESYDPIKKIKVKKRLYDLKKKIRWEGDKAIIPLRKLTMEERKKQDPPDPPSEASFEKVRLMLKELDKDRIEQGLSPREIWKGKKIE